MLMLAGKGGDSGQIASIMKLERVLLRRAVESQSLARGQARHNLVAPSVWNQWVSRGNMATGFSVIYTIVYHDV